MYPFCHVYRVMVAVNENTQVETIFPLQRSGGCLTDGDCAGFDYNREIHIISDLPTKNVDRRITLKQGLALVHCSAQPEPSLTQNAF